MATVSSSHDVSTSSQPISVAKPARIAKITLSASDVSPTTTSRSLKASNLNRIKTKTISIPNSKLAKDHSHAIITNSNLTITKMNQQAKIAKEYFAHTSKNYFTKTLNQTAAAAVAATVANASDSGDDFSSKTDIIKSTSINEDETILIVSSTKLKSKNSDNFDQKQRAKYNYAQRFKNKQNKTAISISNSKSNDFEINNFDQVKNKINHYVNQVGVK